VRLGSTLLFGLALAGLLAAVLPPQLGAGRHRTSVTLAARAIDPPRIIPWRIIGNVAIGMSRTRVEYVYGHGTPDPIFVGGEIFRVPGGLLKVAYDSHDLVNRIETTSPRYHTRDGIGVGMRIPLGPCRRVKSRCEYRWRGFTYSGKEPCCGWFLAIGKKTYVWLATHRGRIVSVLIY
jgi:hypothetical protein